MAPDASLSPELIQAQSFTSAFRGYDASEVRAFLNRVAEEVRAWRERAENLESAWHSAEERAARPPVLDEDTLMAAVGEETAAILRTARAAAAEMRSRAAEEAERALAQAQERAELLTTTAQSEAELVVADARAEAERLSAEAREQSVTMRTEAEAALGQARSAAEAEAAAILAAARLEASAVLEKAHAEAEAARAEADKERRLTIEGAKATRDRILEDLGRRRRVATVQIEQLRAGRERLVETYAVVRRTLEEVQSELSRADAEARAAADVVGRRLGEQSAPELSEDHHLAELPEAAAPGEAGGSVGVGEPGEAGDSVGAGGAVEPGGDGGAVEPGGDGRAVEPGGAGGSAEVGGGGDVSEPGEAGEPPAAGKPTDQEDGSDLEGTPLAGLGPSAVDELFARIRAVPGASRSDPEPEGEALPVGGRGGASLPEETRAEGPPPEAATAAPTVDSPYGDGPQSTLPASDSPSVATGEGGTTAGASPPAPEEEAESAGKGRRKGRRSPPAPGSAPAPPTAPASPVSVTAAPAEPASPVTVTTAPAEPAIDDADEALLQRRDEAVSDLEVVLTRRLKRALQDEQNDVLDRLRNLSGEIRPDRLLTSSEEQAARYVVAAQPLLADAASAGAEFGAETLGASLGDLEIDVDDLASECGESIVAPLRRRLEQAISAGAGEEQAVLVETIGAAYREWKTQRIERLAGDVLTSAFSRGTWESVPARGAVRWLVSDTDGPCPDCDDDALAGVIPKEEGFPTGQHHPPAHTGCRCLLVPVV